MAGHKTTTKIRRAKHRKNTCKCYGTRFHFLVEALAKRFRMSSCGSSTDEAPQHENLMWRENHSKIATMHVDMRAKFQIIGLKCAPSPVQSEPTITKKLSIPPDNK